MDTVDLHTDIDYARSGLDGDAWSWWRAEASQAQKETEAPLGVWHLVQVSAIVPIALFLDMAIRVLMWRWSWRKMAYVGGLMTKDGQAPHQAVQTARPLSAVNPQPEARPDTGINTAPGRPQ